MAMPCPLPSVPAGVLIQRPDRKRRVGLGRGRARPAEMRARHRTPVETQYRQRLRRHRRRADAGDKRTAPVGQLIATERDAKGTLQSRRSRAQLQHAPRQIGAGLAHAVLACKLAQARKIGRIRAALLSKPGARRARGMRPCSHHRRRARAAPEHSGDVQWVESDARTRVFCIPFPRTIPGPPQ